MLASHPKLPAGGVFEPSPSLPTQSYVVEVSIITTYAGISVGLAGRISFCRTLVDFMGDQHHFTDRLT